MKDYKRFILLFAGVSAIVAVLVMLLLQRLSTPGNQRPENTEPPHVHTYSSEWRYDESEHWHPCTAFGCESEKKDAASHEFDEGTNTEATFEADGYIIYTCTVCQFQKTETGEPRREHRYADTYSFDDATHWFACLDEGYESLRDQEAAHVDGNEIVLSAPTATTTGLAEYTCTVCHHTYQKVLQIPISLNQLPSVSSTTVYIGQTLSELPLIGGTAEVEGTFVWRDPDTVITESGSYDALFVPEDDRYQTVPIAVTINATQLTVTVTVGENGQASQVGTIAVNYRGSLSIDMIPDNGYTVDEILLDGKSLAATATLTLENITENHTVSVSFREHTLDVTVTWISGTKGAYTITDTTLTFRALTTDSVYAISGNLEGNIVIDIGDDFKLDLELHGLTVTCATTSPITVLSGNKVSLTAKKGYENVVYDRREAIASDDPTQYAAAIYAVVDLEICGKGSLTVHSDHNNGIRTKDDLEVKNLTLSVTCLDNALKGNDSVTITDATTTLIAKQGDGIKTENSDVSEKGNQRGTVTISGGSHHIYAACDGIDASYDIVIDNPDTVLIIETDQYSEYSESVTEDKNNDSVYYIRFTSNAYQYSVKYYNSDSDFVWENAVYHSQVSGGRTRYYYYAFPKRPEYRQMQVFIYSSDMDQCQEEECLVKSDYLTPHTSYDTFALSSQGGSVYYSWTNYSTSVPMGPGGPGGFGGMQEGNSDKGTYSTKGLKAANAILIENGTITIRSYDDAIHANADTILENGKSPTGNVTINGGILTITTNDDGIHADGMLRVTGGTIRITKSYEGMEGTSIEITGGSVSVVSSDDGINTTATSGVGFRIAGGYVYIYAGGDGIDSNSRTSYSGIVFDGGQTVVISTSNGNSALDSEQGYRYNGGHVIAIMPAGGMSSESTHCQNFNSVGASKTLSISKNSYLTLSVGDEPVITLLSPTSLSARLVYLGNPSFSTTIDTGTSVDLNEDGVYWHE